ncbi:MAG: DUF3108 domain-containing protein [Kiritimatiellaceae bacterium]|nr:DUF3108 domain-containing protein [Kiritimatiellaceae bacterium]
MTHSSVRLLLFFCSVAFLSWGEPLRYPVGETLSYRIVWGIFPVGKMTLRCENIVEKDTQWIRIQVKAKSNQLISTLYPVDDQIDCYISPETGLPVRLEKRTVEGDFICHDHLQFDRARQEARWDNYSTAFATNYAISSTTLDVAAFLYALRSTPFDLGDVKEFTLAVDAFLHGLTITAEEKKELKTMLGDAKIPCTRYSVVPVRNDLFVRKFPGDIWVSDGEQRVLVRMNAKTPLGKVQIILDEISTTP